MLRNADGGWRTADDMRELAGLSIAETIDAMQVLSEGALARQIEPAILSARVETACRQTCARGGAASAESQRNRESAGCGHTTPACGAVGSGQSSHPAAVVPQLRPFEQYGATPLMPVPKVEGRPYFPYRSFMNATMSARS